MINEIYNVEIKHRLLTEARKPHLNPERFVIARMWHTGELKWATDPDLRRGGEVKHTTWPNPCKWRKASDKTLFRILENLH